LLQIKHKIFVITRTQGFKEKFGRRNKTALGPRDRLTLLSILRIWGPIQPHCTNVSDDKQPEFRNQSEFYIIIFLNQQKIVDPPTPKKKEREKNSK